MPKWIESSILSARTRNSCPAKFYNDCGEAKALVDKGQPHELELPTVVLNNDLEIILKKVSKKKGEKGCHFL